MLHVYRHDARTVMQLPPLVTAHCTAMEEVVAAVFTCPGWVRTVARSSGCATGRTHVVRVSTPPREA